MTEASTLFENELVQKFRMLSEEKQQEVLDFVSFLLTKERELNKFVFSPSPQPSPKGRGSFLPSPCRRGAGGEVKMGSYFICIPKVRTTQEHNDETHEISVVEETWGSIPLDKETAKYIAEDKELEYDV